MKRNMKVFVTGGTGFVGRRVVRKLLDRGYTVNALARSAESAALLKEMGAKVVWGDITDAASMREGMRGSDVVFHLAAWYRLGGASRVEANRINVAGTRKTLRLAHELGVPRIIYVSTVNVFGDTWGELVDESYVGQGAFFSEYERTKWLAHYKVALPLIQRGVPIIIVMPGVVYGPGDKSVIGQLMRLFYLEKLPVVPAPETILSYTHVDDIADGLILAAEKGRIGESYILTGPAVPLGEMIDFWGQLTAKRPPLLRVPAKLLRPIAPFLGVLERFVRLPEWLSQEAIQSLGVSYAARADKARAELGWTTRSLHTGMLETFAEIAATSPPPPAIAVARQRRAAALGLVAVASLLFFWLLARRKF
jgi:dihydroflavonol-4-reductase